MFSNRFDPLIKNGFLTQKELEEFLLLEEELNNGCSGRHWLESFHLSNDTYVRLLYKVLCGLVKIKEPGAKEKLQMFIEEKGSQGPAVFLTPWELTLKFLDEEVQ